MTHYSPTILCIAHNKGYVDCICKWKQGDLHGTHMLGHDNLEAIHTHKLLVEWYVSYIDFMMRRKIHAPQWAVDLNYY